MLVSVLMSVYKEKTRFLREAIESILNQTYRNFEFVIVGDSPQSDRERVFSVVEEYALKDNRIKFYPNEHNIGLTKSLNVGLCHCTGKYIARMDADDISVPERLEEQVAFMEANPHFLASGALYELIEEDGSRSGDVPRHIESPEQIRIEILGNSVLGHPISIFHRVINNAEVRYDERFTYAQDYSLWVWILQYGDISNIKEVLLYYRLSKKQISSEHLEEQIEFAKIAQRNAFKLLYGFPLVDSFLEVFSSLTITGDNKQTEEMVMRGYKDFLEEVQVTFKNYYALRFITFVCVGHISRITYKKFYHALYNTTKCNKKMLFWSEVDYIYHKITEIIRYFFKYKLR